MEVSLGLILSLMIIVVTSNSFANGECTGGGLSSGADELTSNTNKVRNRGRTIAKAKIKWSIDLNENKKIAEMFDVSKKELQFMKEGGQWEVYTPTKPVVYTGAYTWNVPRIPCLKYTYRLVVPSKTGDTSNDCFVTRITTLPAESKERIRQAKFIPEKVANVHVGADDSNANVSWSKSLCAEEYQVYLALDDDVEVESKIVPENAEPQAKFSGLSSCTNYVIDIIPNVKGVENEKTIFNHHFHTKPNIASADHLDLSDLVISKDAATLTFYNYMPKVNCLKNFTVQVCPRGKESKNDDCFEDKLEAMDVNLKYSAPNLKHCTNYTLKLTPTYEGININPKMVGFTTKFSEGEEHHSEITESATDVKIAIDNVDCFDSYTISYRLVNNGNNSEWEEEKGDLVTNVIVLDNLSPISTYQIRLDVHDKSGVEKMSVLNTTEITTLRASSGVDRVRSGLEDDDDENKAEDQNPRADNSTSEDNSTETTTPGMEICFQDFQKFIVFYD